MEGKDDIDTFGQMRFLVERWYKSGNERGSGLVEGEGRGEKGTEGNEIDAD